MGGKVRRHGEGYTFGKVETERVLQGMRDGGKTLAGAVRVAGATE